MSDDGRIFEVEGFGGCWLIFYVDLFFVNSGISIWFLMVMVVVGEGEF